jgi:hypothetical protein
MESNDFLFSAEAADRVVSAAPRQNLPIAGMCAKAHLDRHPGP